MIPTSYISPPADVRPDGTRVQQAIIAARLRYPGPVGDYLARELDAWRNFGYRFESTGRMGRLVDALLNQESQTGVS